MDIQWNDDGHSSPDMDDGVNCYGLIKQIYARELKIILPDFAHIKYQKNNRKYIEELMNLEAQNWVEIDKNKVKEFDILRMRGDGVRLHVGVATGGELQHFIHIERDCFVAIERWTSALITPRRVKFYRHISMMAGA